MKLMYIIGQLSYGGAERQLYELIKRLRSRSDYEITVVSLSSNNYPYKKRLDEIGITVIEIPRKKGFDLSRLMKLRRVIQQFQPDIIHSYLENATNYTFWATRFTTYRYIAAVRNASRRRGTARQFLDRISHRFAKHVTVNSHALRKHCMNTLHIPETRLTTIYNFIDFERLEKNYTHEAEEIRQELGISSTDRVIGSIGRLVPQKNPFLFLKVALALADIYPQTKFIVLGEGELRKELMASGKELIKQNRLFYLGHKDHPEYYLKVMDLFLLTSRYEGFPNVALEAMAAEVPVISTPVEGIEEFIVPDKTGLIAQPEPNEFIEKARTLLEGKDLAPTVTKNAHKAIRQVFQEDKLLQQFMSLYQHFTA